MITQSQIADLTDAIVRHFQPQKVILFGSYAYGQPTPDSDVDIMVVMPHEGRSIDKAIEIRLKVYAYVRFPLDLLVRSQEELDRRVALGDWFLREVTAKGKVLYESADARVDCVGNILLNAVP